MSQDITSANKYRNVTSTHQSPTVIGFIWFVSSYGFLFLTFSDGEVPESVAEKTDSEPDEPQAPVVALAACGC